MCVSLCVVCGSLLVVVCWLLVVCNWLCDVLRRALVVALCVCLVLFGMPYWLCVVRCALLLVGVRCSLLVVRCQTLFVVCLLCDGCNV